MLMTPSTAPVGSPFAVDSGGSAWKARYRYDEPSTRTSGLTLILALVLARLRFRRRIFESLDWARLFREHQRPLLTAPGGARCAEQRQGRGAQRAGHGLPLRAKRAAMRLYASRNGNPSLTTSSLACSAACSSGLSSMFS